MSVYAIMVLTGRRASRQRRRCTDVQIIAAGTANASARCAVAARVTWAPTAAGRCIVLTTAVATGFVLVASVCADPALGATINALRIALQTARRQSLSASIIAQGMGSACLKLGVARVTVGIPASIVPRALVARSIARATGFARTVCASASSASLARRARGH